MTDVPKKPSTHFAKVSDILETPPIGTTVKNNAQTIAWQWLLEVERDGTVQTAKLARALRILLSEHYGPR